MRGPTLERPVKAAAGAAAKRRIDDWNFIVDVCSEVENLWMQMRKLFAFETFCENTTINDRAGDRVTSKRQRKLALEE